MTRSDVGRTAFGMLFVLAGILHFLVPAYYRAIVPPYLPAPSTLVALSGVAEVAGGVGLLVPRWRRAAGLGLVVLLLAVLPANVEMLRQGRARGISAPLEAALWLRLPFQFVLMWSAWWLSRAAPLPSEQSRTWVTDSVAGPR
jgi:uncharacterized membrane protein